MFTTRPDTLFGATYMVLAPEHPLIKNLEARIQNLEEVRRYVERAKIKAEEERIREGRKKTGVELKGIKAVNPANGEEIRMGVGDYVWGNVGTGAIMAVPAHDQRDFEFAKKFNLPIKMVICPHYPEKTCPMLDAAYVGEGHLVGSGKFDGLPSQKAKWEISKFVGGERRVQYRLRDWLISRQRYWGPPIPMIYCEKCNWQPVSEKDLPVLLPKIKNFKPTGTGQGPLASVKSFYETSCPKCKGKAKRETDVSDAFLDSVWYFLRYPSVKDHRHPWDQEITKKWLPVHMYIGGTEHSVLHLLYSRFLTMAFHDFGLLDFEEPFFKFRAHGLILKDGAKMSKSKGNVVNPDEYFNAYGVDAIRMYLAFLAPLTEGGDFRDTGIKGVTRFLERVWRFYMVKAEQNDWSNKSWSPGERVLHQTIFKVTRDFESLQYNTAISYLMILLTGFELHGQMVTKKEAKIFLQLLAPLAPYITEELWHRVFNEKNSIHKEPWPEYDQKLIQGDTFELIIQVNGKMRGKVTLPVSTDEEKAKKAALAQGSVKKYITEEPTKVVFVPNRLINFVV